MLALFLVAAFIIAMIGLGVWGMGRTRTPTDFFLGGRQIGPWASAFAYGTSYFSAVVFIGFAGQFGWNYGLDALGIAVVWGGYLVVSGRPELTPVAASVAMVVPFFVIPVVSMCSTPPYSDLLRDAFAEDSFVE